MRPSHQDMRHPQHLGFQATHLSTDIVSSSPEPRLAENPSSPGPPQEPRTVFISGPLAPDSDFFKLKYTSRLLAAMAAGDSFVIGSSRGIDALALDFLRAQHVSPSRIQIFFYAKELHGSTKHRLCKDLEKTGIRQVIKGRNHTERDEAMTAASDYDILAYLSCMEISIVKGSVKRSSMKEEEPHQRPSSVHEI